MLPYLVAAAVAIPAFVILGDLLYSLIVKARYRRWEAGIERDAEGVREGCREFTLGDGEDAVLLVHGFGDSPSVFQSMAPALAAQGFTCHGLRLPQYALTMARYRATGADRWCESVRSALKELRGRHKRVYLLAHSLGAAVSVEAVADAGRRRWTAWCCWPRCSTCPTARSPLLPARTWYRLLDGVLVFTDRVRMAFPPDLLDKSAAEFDARGQVHSARRHPRTVPACWRGTGQGASRFASRVLMILARHDLVVDNAAAERFFHDLRRPAEATPLRGGRRAHAAARPRVGRDRGRDGAIFPRRSRPVGRT